MCRWPGVSYMELFVWDWRWDFNVMRNSKILWRRIDGNITLAMIWPLVVVRLTFSCIRSTLRVELHTRPRWTECALNRNLGRSKLVLATWRLYYMPIGSSDVVMNIALWSNIEIKSKPGILRRQPRSLTCQCDDWWVQIALYSVWPQHMSSLRYYNRRYKITVWQIDWRLTHNLSIGLCDMMANDGKHKFQMVCPGWWICNRDQCITIP